MHFDAPPSVDLIADPGGAGLELEAKLGLHPDGLMPFGANVKYADFAGSLPDPSVGAACATIIEGTANGHALGSPRPGLAKSTSVSRGPAAPCHPQRWTEEQVRAWWDKKTRRRKEVTAPPKGTHGRNIMRWPIGRFEQLCGGNAGLAIALYQDLRNEIERYEQWRRSCMASADHKHSLTEDKAWQPASPRSQSCGRAAWHSISSSQDPGHRCLPRPCIGPSHEVFTGGGAPMVGDGYPDTRTDLTRLSPSASRADDSTRRPPVKPHPHDQQDRSHRKAESPVVGIAGTTLSARTVISRASPQRRLLASAGAEEEKPLHRRGAPAAAKAKSGSFKYATGARPNVDHNVAPSGSKARIAAGSEAARCMRDSRAPVSAPTPKGSRESGAVMGGSLSSDSAGYPDSRDKSAPRASRMQASTATLGTSQHTSRQAIGGPTLHITGDMHTEVRQVTTQSLVMEEFSDEVSSKVDTPRQMTPPDVSENCLLSQLSRDDSDIAKPSKSTPAAFDRPDEEDADTRQMFDKRELRKRHKNLFDEQLIQWRQQHLAVSPTLVPGVEAAATSRVRVYVRKRPLFDYERQADEFDVVSIRAGMEVVVHNCLTKADLKSLFISHMGFQFAHAFSERATDDEVYTRCAFHAVRHVSEGSVATIFMFGQTGSGKTHTMGGIVRRASEQLFSEGSAVAGRAGGSFAVAVTAFEIAGKAMRDLLDMSGERKELKVMEDKGHRTHVLGVKACHAESPEQLLSIVQKAQAQRATRATQVNDTSSRSHAVIRIYCYGGVDGVAAAASAMATEPAEAMNLPHTVLTLVDCAGSERNADTTHHDAQSRKDAAEINSTIFALKECFRVMRSSKCGQHPPYRESLLTRVLADSFASDRAMIVAIGTVSPSATDTEHSKGTLQALQQLQGTQMAFQSREDVARPRADREAHPRRWTEAQVRQWIEAVLGANAPCLNKGTDGKILVRWPVQRFIQLCGGEADIANRLYDDLRLRSQNAGQVVA